MATAKEIFETLEKLGDEALDLLRQQAFTPEIKKTLRHWGITEASQMIGCSDTYIREKEKRGSIPKPSGKSKRGRQYNLTEINKIRESLSRLPTKEEADETAIIAFANFKGGAAKTTSAVHAAQYFSLQGYRVLFIDCDSQASATQMFGYNPDEHIDNDKTLLPCLLQEIDSISSVIRSTYWDKLDLIPANLALYGAEFSLPARTAHAKAKNQNFNFYSILSDYLHKLDREYDVIIIDCPPSMGMISINAIFAANAFIIPVPPSMLDFASTIQFFAMVREVLAALPDKEYAFIRLLITKHDNQDSNNTLVDTLRALYGNFVLRNMMYTSEAVRKASNDLLTLYEIDKYAGNKNTFLRAISFMDEVNSEIEKLAKQMWPSTHHKESLKNSSKETNLEEEFSHE